MAEVKPSTGTGHPHRHRDPGGQSSHGIRTPSVPHGRWEAVHRTDEAVHGGKSESPIHVLGAVAVIVPSRTVCPIYDSDYDSRRGCDPRKLLIEEILQMIDRMKRGEAEVLEV